MLVTLIEGVTVLLVAESSDELIVLGTIGDDGIEDVKVDGDVEVAPRPWKMNAARPALLVVLVLVCSPESEVLYVGDGIL